MKQCYLINLWPRNSQRQQMRIDFNYMLIRKAPKPDIILRLRFIQSPFKLRHPCTFLKQPENKKLNDEYYKNFEQYIFIKLL